MKFDCTATRHHNSRAKSTWRSATKIFPRFAGAVLINAWGMCETRSEELLGRYSHKSSFNPTCCRLQCNYKFQKCGDVGEVQQSKGQVKLLFTKMHVLRKSVLILFHQVCLVEHKLARLPECVFRYLGKVHRMFITIMLKFALWFSTL